jgi:hypothetical protein
MEEQAEQREYAELVFAAEPGPLPERRTVMPNAVVMTGYGPPEVLK